ncbi:MAG: hypothetical protein CMM07_13210 [Rhodopirellula sp.]|nr:hypothetical protein [Rhodopirellula sp.]
MGHTSKIVERNYNDKTTDDLLKSNDLKANLGFERNNSRTTAKTCQEKKTSPRASKIPCEFLRNYATSYAPRIDNEILE